jgi:hypothetical protein
MFVALVCRDVHDVLSPELTESFREEAKACQRMYRCLLLYAFLPDISPVMTFGYIHTGFESRTSVGLVE